MKRRGLLVGGLAGAAGAASGGYAWWRGQQRTAAASPGAVVPAPAALWTLRFVRPEGGELAMDSLRGKPLLINFWATWCAPCVRELPVIDRFHRDTPGVQVLGLAVDGPTPVRDFLRRVQISYPIGLAGLDGTDLVRALGNLQGGLPFTVLIGADGQVLQRRLGETNQAELSGWARAL